MTINYKVKTMNYIWLDESEWEKESGPLNPALSKCLGPSFQYSLFKLISVSDRRSLGKTAVIATLDLWTN